MNQSPWLYQLDRTRPVAELTGKHETEVAIIGAGIAGVATAYFTLKNTKKNVILIDASKVAHGATGHNGGFLASYFERTFSSLIQEFGLKMTAEAQLAIESSWTLLDQIREEANMQTPMWQFTGYTGCATLDEIIVRLRNNALRTKSGMSPSQVMISKEAPFLKEIPSIYKDLYTLVAKKKILSLLETTDEEYVAILPSRKGCMNSAMFCEELVCYLLLTYPERFQIAEETPVKRLVLKADYAVLDINRSCSVTAEKVVLCTNGFEKIKIVNIAGANVDKKFHQLVRGIVGYMAAYLEKPGKAPAEISYLPKRGSHFRDIYEEEPYYYLTRRPFILNGETKNNLICVGGPEMLMDDTTNYMRDNLFPSEARDEINKFLQYTYTYGPKKYKGYEFLWHGLMGFTPNSVRLIGPEPCNPILYYNLGCNGVGLLPSIYGGQKISLFLSGKKLKPSIFDPKDSRKILAKKPSKKQFKLRKVKA